MKRWRQLLRDLLSRAIARIDRKTFDAYGDTPNGSARLIAFHDAVLDADDTLQAVERAIGDEHYSEAYALIKIGRDSLAERLAELKGHL